MTRTSVSVPEALKEKMRAYEAQMNWSAIACRAFEKEITQHETVNRLRKEKQEQSKGYQDGYRSGQRWVLSTATYRVLLKIENCLYRDTFAYSTIVNSIYKEIGIYPEASIDFVEGFIEGVIDQWREIKKYI